MEEGYTASSYTGLRTALEAASAVNENPEASKTMVEEQQTLLNTALEGMKEAADITVLQAEIKKADSFVQKKDSYSADSYAAFKAALEAAGELNSADTEMDQQKTSRSGCRKPEGSRSASGFCGRPEPAAGRIQRLKGVGLHHSRLDRI